MAARLRARHQDEIRLKIQVSQLINVLQEHALRGRKKVAPSRLDAAKFLISRVLPPPDAAPHLMAAIMELTGQTGQVFDAQGNLIDKEPQRRLVVVDVWPGDGSDRESDHEDRQASPTG